MADRRYLAAQPQMGTLVGLGLVGQPVRNRAPLPGHRFTLIAGPEAHHDRVRFTWSLAADGAAPVAIGVDFARLAGDGRMRSITGFLEPAA